MKVNTIKNWELPNSTRHLFPSIKVVSC